MPPSIDPITNLFATGSSIIGRVIISFAAGWLGNFLSKLCASFNDWGDFTNPMGVMSDVVDIFTPMELLNIVLWPLIVLHYLLSAPIYGLLLMIVIMVCLYKILRADDPVLFWAVLLVASLTPGLPITHGNLCSLVPFSVIGAGLGAALWYAVNLDHPEWVDWFREKTGM